MEHFFRQMPTRQKFEKNLTIHPLKGLVLTSILLKRAEFSECERMIEFRLNITDMQN
jgi:hypothetical protein